MEAHVCFLSPPVVCSVVSGLKSSKADSGNRSQREFLRGPGGGWGRRADRRPETPAWVAGQGSRRPHRSWDRTARGRLQRPASAPAQDVQAGGPASRARAGPRSAVPSELLLLLPRMTGSPRRGPEAGAGGWSTCLPAGVRGAETGTTSESPGRVGGGASGQGGLPEEAWGLPALPACALHPQGTPSARPVCGPSVGHHLSF